MKKRVFVILSCLFLSSIILFAQQTEENQTIPNFWDDEPNEILAKKIIDQMTNSELFTQIFMLSWEGAEPDSNMYKWIDKGLGSIKLFGRNTDNLKTVAKTVSSLQKEAQSTRFQIPLFVATDQEGGSIRHVKGDTTITPGNMAIGASGYPEDAWLSAYYINREIKALGINMNFAPTVDLFTNHESSIIGIRSFGDDPDKDGVLASAFVSGSKAAGVLPTVKHFPGHGDTSLDSHGRLPVIDINEETLQNRELIPYKYLIKEEVPVIMSGHLSYPQIEPSGAPASLSKHFLTDILRNQLGYQGLIITDDMEMAGATIFAGSVSNSFKLAIEAGNDIILSSQTSLLSEDYWYTKNTALMETDSAFYDRVKDAAYRVVKAKLDYFKSGNPIAPLYPDSESLDEFIPDKEGDSYFLEQACRSITVEKQGVLPLDKENCGNILLLGSLSSFFTAAKERFPEAGEVRFGFDAGPNEAQWVIERLPTLSENYDTIIICVSNENHAKIANYFKDSGKKIIIFSTMSPEITKSLSWCDSILLGYSWRCEYTYQAMVAAANGEFEPEGQKPYN